MYKALHLTTVLAIALISLVACASTPQSGPMILAGNPQIARSMLADQQQLDRLSLTALSANFVDRVIHDLPVQAHMARFAMLTPMQLEKALDTPAAQLSFWINLYNGHAQYFLKTDPSLYQQDRSSFFGKDQIQIAGYSVSMEDIEHGVLRRGATIWSFGHLRSLLFRREFIRRFAVDTVDYRIHFALNCSAASCPPVMVYRQATLDQQLDANSQHYLATLVKYDASENRVQVPALLNWFSADFGSRKDKLTMLQGYGLIPANARPTIDYLDYDWRMQIANYALYAPKPKAN